MSDASAPVIFYFDYISPNAYLAWCAIHELAARHQREVQPRAVLFAGLLGATGRVGPAEVEPQRRWMFRDVMRKARRHAIPLEPPASHPFNPLLALRVTGLVHEPAQRHRLVHALFRAVWAESSDISDPAVVGEVIDSVALDGRQLVARAGQPESKAALRDATDAALAQGAFGVPSMIVGDELFWGFDDFAHLDEHLAGRDRLDPESLSSWAAVRPTATRNRPGS